MTCRKFLIIVATALAMSGCAKKDPPLFTNVVYTQVQMLIAANTVCGDGSAYPVWQAEAYAQVSSVGLAAYAERYRADLFKKGIPISEVTGNSGWNIRFNCSVFADTYLDDAACELFVAQFNVFSAAQRPAVFVVWYRPLWAPVMPDGLHQMHAINLVLTEAGAKFIEPQKTGGTGEVVLTPAEVATISYRRA